MKKTIIILTSLFTLLQLCFSGQPIPKSASDGILRFYELEEQIEYNEQGTIIYHYKDDIENIYTYDDQNRLIKYVKTSGPGYTITNLWEYDDRGNLIREIDHSKDKGQEHIFQYDENNVLIFYSSLPVYSSSRGDRIKEWYTYDENGRLISKKEIDDDIIDYTYDENGNLLYELQRDSNKGVIYQYDSNNRLIHKETTSKIKWDYEYDEKGRLIHEKKYYKRDIPYEEFKEYDDEDRLIRHKYTTAPFGGEGSCDDRFEYDKKGNMIHQTSWEGSYHLNNYFDNNNNLIKTVETGYGHDYITNYKYDENNNLIYMDHNRHLHTGVYKQYLKYNEKNLPIEISDSLGKISIIEYEYFDNGSLKKKSVYSYTED